MSEGRSHSIFNIPETVRASFRRHSEASRGHSSNARELEAGLQRQPSNQVGTNATGDQLAKAGTHEKVHWDDDRNIEHRAEPQSDDNHVEKVESNLERITSKPSGGISKMFKRSRRVDEEEGGPSTEVPVEPPEYTAEAWDLVRTFTAGHPNLPYTTYPETGDTTAANSSDDLTRKSIDSDTPAADRRVHDADYVPAPKHYKPSIFGAILTSRLNALQPTIRYDHDSSPPAEHIVQALKKIDPTRHRRGGSETPGSGSATPINRGKWYTKSQYAKSSTANMLVQAGLSTSTPVSIPTYSGYQKDVVAEVADIIARRRFLIKLCDALMRYGAPTHRLEEYLSSAARALAIDADFMYIPGAMMCTFNDHSIQTNTVELVRKREGLDFGRLIDAFNVYKLAIHDKITAEQGIFDLDHIVSRPDTHGVWFRILMFGISSVLVGPFSFQARPIDFAPIFVLGCALGFMQLKVVPRSDQFSNVFEVFASVMTAFIARGIGSIRGSDGTYIFCFSATAQSSIAMILPGFMVLNSALELQGRSVVSGSVRMIYSIIYVLFLGFGLLVGTIAFGLIKRDAVSDVTCAVPTWFEPTGWQLLYTRFIWAPAFACTLAIVYRAKWSQLPIMALIAVCGHQANYWISTVLSSNLQVANAVGAFVIGCVAHLYSRMFHGLAAAAMLPAIYCQVPGGLAASGSLVAGVESADQIFGNSSSVSVANNGTSSFVAAQNDPNSVYGGTIFNVGYGMVQVAIGISVGLYLSALVVYPYGKRRSGLFSF